MTENKGKVAIVTGASKNIGRATCDSLSKLGFNVLVHANSDKEGAMETLEIVKKNGVNADIFIGDLTKEDTSGHLVDAGSKILLLTSQNPLAAKYSLSNRCLQFSSLIVSQS